MILRKAWVGVWVLALASVATARPEVLFPPFEDAESRALAALSGARVSVDVAQYNIRNERFFDALSDLRARGVRVRIVVDAKNARQPWNTLDDRFEAAGFDLVRYENTRSRYAIMHHKFTIIDDALVLTGSYNWNHTAQVVNDENMIVLREPALVAAYREDLLLLRDPALARRYTVAFGALVRRYDPGAFQAGDYGIARADAAVHFVVRMPRTRPGEEVVVTGDHPALGGWDPQRGLVLRTSESLFPTWAGSVRLSAGSHVTWKAVVRRSRGRPVWELGADRVIDVDRDGADGVVDVSFRDLVEVQVRASVTLPAGAELRLVGGDLALGAWDPALGWPLVADPAQPGVFGARVPLPGRAWIGAKLVLVMATGSPRWERGRDRWLRVHDRDAPQLLDLVVHQD